MIDLDPVNGADKGLCMSVLSDYCPKCGAYVRWKDRWEHYLKCREEK